MKNDSPVERKKKKGKENVRNNQTVFEQKTLHSFL